jgi:hypothetical protein
MARNIRNRRVELRPRKKERLIEFFERSLWPRVPSEVIGKMFKKVSGRRFSVTDRMGFEFAYASSWLALP